MNETNSIIRFRNANGVRFRAVPVEGGYQIQTRSFFLWFNETVEIIIRKNIGFSFHRISTERVPLRCSHAEFRRMVENGTIKTSSGKPANLETPPR